jgi:hypothetical protein
VSSTTRPARDPVRAQRDLLDDRAVRERQYDDVDPGRELGDRRGVARAGRHERGERAVGEVADHDQRQSVQRDPLCDRLSHRAEADDADLRRHDAKLAVRTPSGP